MTASDRKNVLNIPGNLLDNLEAFRLKVDAYKKKHVDLYAKHMELPVYIKRNIRYDQEVVANTGFFRVCEEKLSDNDASIELRQECAVKIMHSIAKLHDDIEIYSEAPEISNDDKQTCLLLLKDLADVSRSVQKEYRIDAKRTP